MIEIAEELLKFVPNDPIPRVVTMRINGHKVKWFVVGPNCLEMWGQHFFRMPEYVDKKVLKEFS